MGNKERFEELLKRAADRPGFDGLLNYIRKSDFYTAPASTKFHLSCEGGLLQHSLNVYDALVGRLQPGENDTFRYLVHGKEVVAFKRETLVIVALLHDLCKTNFYETEMRNQKTYDPEKVKAASSWQVKKDNAGQFIWESVPTYVVNDKNPYGHGEKSVMMIEEFMKLTMEERYAIRWHMGMGDCTYNEVQAFNKSCEKFPLVLLLHIADQEASHFMEDTQKNKELFQKMDVPDDEFQEAEPV